MKSFIVNKDGSTEIKEIPKPRYHSKQALVKTIACGMCGTDVKLLHRTFKGFPESVYPIMLGHEGVGEVVEVGSEVKSFQVGDRIRIRSFIPAWAPGGEPSANMPLSAIPLRGRREKLRNADMPRRFLTRIWIPLMRL